jgi:hypothetical protein
MFRRRLEALEAAQPAERWSIGIDWVDNWTETGGGRVVLSLPPRRLLPGETFDYERELARLFAALEQGGGTDGKDTAV